MRYISIGQMSKLSGCKIPTIRFYEQEGLVPPAFRTEGNQRRYQTSHLTRLRFVLHARELGFTLDDIRELIHLADQEPYDHQADKIAARQLAEVERKLARLNSLKTELSAMLNGCQAGDSRKCNVIDVLSDHALCSSDHILNN